MTRFKLDAGWERKWRALRSLLALFTCCVIAVSGGGDAQAARTIQLAANEWQPYTGSGMAQQGIAVQIVRTALQRAGYDVIVRFSNWPRALHETYNGASDGVVAVWSTAARSQRLLFSDKYLDSRMAAAGIGRRFVHVRKLSELRSLKIGIGRDYDYSEEFLSERLLSVQPVDHAMQNLLKLTLGRVDVVLEDRLIIRHNISHHIVKHPELQAIQLSNNDLLLLPIYMGIRKDLPDAEVIIRRFNTELRGMMQDGTMKTLLRGWNLAP